MTPLFDFRCQSGHVFEMLERGTVADEVICPECQKPSERLFSAPGFVKVRGGRYRKDIKVRRPGEGINLKRKTGEF